ncbi:DUF4190 domain-containing protein [Brevibacterium atlanticum]|uniref:DUF4190 domain-containing protein n=1 Tax=Brevibacterium atlanticum TaxID=2697563 RepID=UPI001422A3A1|nr:DUF4190 domain-containing protein [Brevibacterium atlanticum]
MDTRQLPIGSTYTGSNRSSAANGSVSAASVPAGATVVPAPVHMPATYGNPAPVHTPVTYGNAAPVVIYQQVAPTNSAAIVSLVLTLISFVSSAFFFGIVGIIFGHVARSQIKKRGEQGNGMAVAGLWLGYLSVLFWIGFWLVYFGIVAVMIGVGIAAEGGTVS